MQSAEIRTRFLDFFAKRGHTVVPSSSLLPDDPSVLLTTAGMQQFKRYYTGECDAMKDFGSKNTASIQKCFRTSCIDEVGDATHGTFFEMLGNFSFGGYFKEESIKWAHEFIIKEMSLAISYVTIFGGKASDASEALPPDNESRTIWNSLGITDVREEGMADVFWGPTGSSGPCGPTTEIYCKNGAGEDIEVWNIVFNQFFYPGSREELNQGVAGKKLELLKTPGVDTGMGLERLVMCVQQTPTIFETDLFAPVLSMLPRELELRKKRIAADHGRATVFLIADGVRPSNKGAGYVLRRVLRRLISVVGAQAPELCRAIIDLYRGPYPELSPEVILPIVADESAKFTKTLRIGLRELKRIPTLDAKVAFMLYESYGLPYEVIKDYAQERATLLRREDFDQEFARHQEISRAGQEKKFGGHGLLLDTGELKAKDEVELKVVTRLHTATHMLQQALREVLGLEVHQAGSDIAVERTRFDFTFPRKLTSEEIKKVEDLVNQKVQEDLPMQKVVLPKVEAEKTGALYFFKEKYPDPVNVYFMGHDLKTAWSKEFCGGPHVTHSGAIGHFQIIKEEACAAGVRRIRAIVK